jgi:hypothetical protein
MLPAQAVPLLDQLLGLLVFVVPLALGAFLGWFLKMAETNARERGELRSGVALLLADLDRTRQRLLAPDAQDLPRQLPAFEVMQHRGPLARLPIGIVKELLEVNDKLAELAALAGAGSAGSSAEARLYWNDTAPRRAALRAQAVERIAGLEAALARRRWLGFRGAWAARRELGL